MNQPYDMPLSELKDYLPPLTREKNFDKFWDSSLAELKSVPMEYSLHPAEYPARGIKMYKLDFKGFNNSSISGWFAIPDSKGPHPGILHFHGYNWAFDGRHHDVANYALRGYAVLFMYCRGQQGDSIDNTISPHGQSIGWMTKGLLSPEKYYYRAVYMDAVRAMDILASIDGVNKDKIAVVGESQGGALALATAALSPIPIVSVTEYHFLSHFNRAIDICPDGPYGELNEFFRRNSDPQIEIDAKKNLSYIDIMNHAPNIKCHCLTSIGLIDTITPPSTVFAAFNHMKCSKEVSVFRYFGHEYIPGFLDKKLKTLMEFLF
jgi:cephalosporin-C deacetylase